jgi:hypothetical protein
MLFKLSSPYASLVEPVRYDGLTEVDQDKVTQSL